MGRFTTILTFCAFALLGYLLLHRVAVRWQPTVEKATLQISYNWPGASPQAIETQVTAPLEAAIALVQDIEEIRSTSSDGSGTISLKVSDRADHDFIRFNVASQIRRLYPDLPSNLTYPTLNYATSEYVNDLETPILTYSLSGPVSPTELYLYAKEHLAPSVSLQSGLSRIEITGGNRLEWRIHLDPEGLAATGLSVEKIQARVIDHFARSGLGFLQKDTERLYAYRADIDKGLSAINITDLSQVQVANSFGQLFTLGDLATIAHLPMAPVNYYRINGTNNVRLLAFASAKANQLVVGEEFRKRILAQIPFLPAGYKLRIEEDATEYLHKELDKTRGRTAISIGVLLFCVLIFYRSIRRIGAVLIALIVNLGLAFMFYWAVGVELNLYAFAGIAVSFGIMIDNVIIVIDELHTKNSGGQVGAAIAGATLTTLASLSVVFFLSNELQYQLFELARVMTINLGTSVAVALYFVPALLYTDQVMVKEKAGFTHNQLLNVYVKIIQLFVHFRKTSITLIVLTFGLPIWWLPNQLDGWPLYNKSLGSEYYIEVLKPQMTKYLGGTFHLFSRYVYGESGFIQPEQTKLFLQASLPDGATIEQLNDVFLLVERHLANQPDEAIDQYITRVSSGQQGSLEITFPDGDQEYFPAQLKNNLTNLATDLGGIEWDIFGVGQGFSNSNRSSPIGFRVELKGYNKSGLDQYSARLNKLLVQHPRVQDVDTDANIKRWEQKRSEYLMNFQQDNLTLQNLYLQDIYTALRWFDQNDRPDFYLQGVEPVIFKATAPDQYDSWRLMNWSIPLDSNLLSFPSVADFSKRSAAPALHKVDQQYLRMVTFDYNGRPEFGRRHLDACLDTLRAELPLGFTAERRTLSRNAQAREMSYLIGLAVVLIFFICALLFESLRQAFSIVMLIPVSCIGIFLTFYWFNVRLDQGGYTSFLLVSGLAVNGLILIVNEYNYLRKNYGEYTGVKCYGEAIRRKLTPILLTVASTAAGLVPFLMGGRNEVFWHALAAGTIGGLLFSVFVIIFISPLFFLAQERE